MRHGVLLLLAFSLLAGKLAAQSAVDVPTLEAHKPIKRELAGGQTHSYRTALASGQYISVVVYQQGIDVVVTLLGPDDKKVTEVDSPNGAHGPEHVFAIAAASGIYHLEIRSLKEDASADRYEVKIEELRPATRQDESRIIAERNFNEADLLYLEGSPESLQTALRKFDEARRRFHALGNRRREAAALNGLGSVYSSLGDRRKALGYYSQALSLRRAVRDRQGEAATLNNLGLTYLRLGQTTKALGHFTRSLSLFRSVRDRGGQGTALNSIGLIYTSQGQTRRALQYYRWALPLFESVRDRFSIAITFNNLGYVYNMTGEAQQALDYHTRALPIFKSEGDPRGEAMAQNGLGAAHFSLGNTQRALGYYFQALPVLEKVGEPGELASVLNNLGLLYDATGEKQKALDHYGRAQPIFHQIRDVESETTTLNNIGLIYDGLGDRRNALRYHNQALSISRAGKNPGQEAMSLNNIGHVYDSSGEWQRALTYYKQALKLFRATGNRRGAAATLNNIGVIYRGLGDDWVALGYFKRAVDLSRAIGARYNEAAALNNISGLYYRLNGVNARRRALDHARRALLISREVGNSAGEAAALYNLASVARADGNPDEALLHIKTALKITDTVRGNIIRQELRSSYVATVQDYNEFYVDLLMHLHKERPSGGFDAAALQASEHARARGLLELLNEAHADIRRDVSPELLQQGRSLQQLIDAKAAARMRLLAGRYTAAQATAAAHEIEELTTKYQEVEARIRQSSQRYAELTQPTPLSLEEIQGQLDKDTLLLEYYLGWERSYLWLVSPTELKSFELPGRRAFEIAARSFYESLNKPDDIYADPDRRQVLAVTAPDVQLRDVLKTPAGLSHILLGPVASLLGQKRLVIVADGALHYVPFAAVPDPADFDQSAQRMQPLGLRHEVVNLPSVSALVTTRRELASRKPAPKELAVLADPVFDAVDARVKQDSAGREPRRRNASPAAADPRAEPDESAEPGPGARQGGNAPERLEASRAEAEAIMKFVSADQAMAAFNFAASKALATSGELSHYRRVHFATHGQIDSTHPELSSVVLSLVDENGHPQDGYLRAHDIYNLDLPADLVVLSGCETALGSEIRGEGLIGLTRGFMYAGAGRVVASLWSVKDAATAELMVRFYRGMLKEGKRPAEALRAAQVEMSQGGRWQAPHYWAAFVLQGEWR